ncbi:MAG: GNAT family N-acetyltransferase [Candidatus Hodarchaeales archaeon]|jgi:RimJ/RimL family protein N-acetyltransferase
MRENNLENIEIAKLDIQNLSREDWNIFHIFRKKIHLEFDPDDPFIPDDVEERDLKIQVSNPYLRVHMFQIIDKNKPKQIIGTYYLAFYSKNSPSYDQNKHVGRVGITILPEYRKKGIATKVLRKLLHKSKEKDFTIYIFHDVTEQSGKHFLKAINAKNALLDIENRVKIKNVPWDLVKEWNRISEAIDSEMKFFYIIPDNIINEYSIIFTEVLNQAPLGDLAIKNMTFTPEILRQMEKDDRKNNDVRITAITIEPNNEISGLTEVKINRDLKIVANQSLTGVKTKYRGKGLGKWLKAAMLLRIREEFPEVTVMKTGNASSNAPMLSINTRLGYEKYKEKITGQITVEKLQKYLEGNNRPS